MRAAGHVDHAPGSDVVSLHSRPSHPTPVYASGPRRPRASTTSLDASLRGWPVQLAQWALVFAALGLLIGGIKWWDRHRAHDVSSPTQTNAVSVMTAGSNGDADR